MAFEDKPGCKIIINYHLFSRQVVGKRQKETLPAKKEWEGRGGSYMYPETLKVTSSFILLNADLDKHQIQKNK